MGGCRCDRTAESYDPKTNKWSWIAPMNTERSDGSAAALNDKMYVAGGCSVGDIQNSVEVYDPDTDLWTFVAPMHSGRWPFSCVEFHGCLYALGGHNLTSSKLSTEKYVPAEDTWTKIPYMNFYAYKLNAEVIDDMIFVITGYYDRTKFVPQVACFDDKENRWFVSLFLLLLESTRK
ncbi:Kelch-like protein 10 [Zootermopsis nevadensis]|uniref:Kelch-like protein 10 n=1 Tax=Zootermopsis nevadensis TaxID=136037 RepID=A0A067QLN8_ZOONE|nr:Kelch-like protein 10 [Zootermopsis nevadensis]